MRRLVVLLVALLEALLAAFFAGPALAANGPAEMSHGYSYDSRHVSANPAHSATERGPPTTYNRHLTYDATGHWSHGDSPRLSVVGPGPKTTYPPSEELTPEAKATGTTPTSARVDVAELSSFQGSRAATNTGYTASKINITDDGLSHVLDCHLADGTLSAGKSVFNDNVTITRLIADADAGVPIAQGNGNLAYIVDAGRTIGLDRATGQATSVYTVITRPSGDLVTAFPGTP